MTDLDPEDYETLKRILLERSREQMKKLHAREEQKVRMMDWRGTNPIPRFRNRHPEEDRREYIAACSAASQSFLKADLQRRDILRHQGFEPAVVEVREGVYRLDWVGVMRVAGTIR